jgi:hypothetical protein
MDLPDPQSFIIRFWPEEVDADSGRTKWRGHVTHVTSNRRRYIKKLQDINDFITDYLVDLNADITDL